MRLVVKTSGRFTYLYAIKGYRTDDGKSTTKVVRKFGTVEELREKLEGADPIEWAKAEVAAMTERERRDNQKVKIECDPRVLIPPTLMYYKVGKNQKTTNRPLSGLGL